MPRIFTYADRPVLAGLTWGPGRPSSLLRRGSMAAVGSSTGSLAARSLAARSLAANNLALHWDDRTALVPEEPEYLGVAALLSVLAGDLSEKDRIDHVIGNRVLCAFELTEQHLYFAAVLVNGKPAIGAERLFDTRAELISHIEAECSSGQIDRLAIAPDLAEDIAEEVTRRVPMCSLCPPDVDDPTVDDPTVDDPTVDDPVCVEGRIAPKRPVWQIAAVAGTATLALAAGFLFLSPGQHAKPVVAAPQIAPLLTTFRDEAGFGRNCLAAFAGIWPTAPGWQLTAEGCATPAMRDPAITGFAPALANDLALANDRAVAHDRAVAYRIYQLRGGFDAAIARKAAKAVYTGSAVAMEIRGNRLFSSFEIAVPLLKAIPDQSDPTSLARVSQAQMAQVSMAPAELLATTEAVFLGLADSIVLEGGGSNAGGMNAKVRVMLKSGFDEIFARVGRIEGAEVARLSRSGKTVTLEITTRRAVLVPMSITGIKAAPTDIAEEQSAVAPRDANPDMETAVPTEKGKML